MTNESAIEQNIPAKQHWNAPWFWYSIICVLCWGGWAMLSKLCSEQIEPNTMQFLFTIGTIPVGIALLIARRGKLEKNPLGISYGVLIGGLSGVGGLSLFAAYHTNGNTAVITVATSLYPIVTVLLAVLILHERLGLRQILGLLFAAISIVIFSL